jgi:hypothetical protein
VPPSPGSASRSGRRRRRAGSCRRGHRARRGERERHRACGGGIRAERRLRRARRPAAIAERKSSASPGPTVSWARAVSSASPTWPRISDSPSTSESSPEATRERCRATSTPAWTHRWSRRSSWRRRGPARAPRRLVARVLDPAGQPRVQLHAVAGLQHGVLEDGRAPLGAEPERRRSRSSTGAVRWLSPTQTRRYAVGI